MHRKFAKPKQLAPQLAKWCPKSSDKCTTASGREQSSQLHHNSVTIKSIIHVCFSLIGFHIYCESFAIDYPWKAHRKERPMKCDKMLQYQLSTDDYQFDLYSSPFAWVGLTHDSEIFRIKKVKRRNSLFTEACFWTLRRIALVNPCLSCPGWSSNLLTHWPLIDNKFSVFNDDVFSNKRKQMTETKVDFRSVVDRNVFHIKRNHLTITRKDIWLTN